MYEWTDNLPRVMRTGKTNMFICSGSWTCHGVSKFESGPNLDKCDDPTNCNQYYDDYTDEITECPETWTTRWMRIGDVQLAGRGRGLTTQCWAEKETELKRQCEYNGLRPLKQATAEQCAVARKRNWCGDCNCVGCNDCDGSGGSTGYTPSCAKYCPDRENCGEGTEGCEGCSAECTEDYTNNWSKGACADNRVHAACCDDVDDPITCPEAEVPTVDQWG